MTTPTCPRHPDVETRLRCSACDSLICPSCGREAAVGHKCPECAAQEWGSPPPGSVPGDRTEGGPPRPAGGLFGRLTGSASSGAGRRHSEGRSSPPPTPPGERLPIGVGARGTGIGLAAAFLGGLLLSPVLLGGTFLLLSSGLIGWLVARAVYWGTEGRNSAYVRATALTLSGFSIAVALVTAGASTAPPGLLFLAYPAAVYGGWIVVRRR